MANEAAVKSGPEQDHGFGTGGWAGCFDRNELDHQPRPGRYNVIDGRIHGALYGVPGGIEVLDLQRIGGVDLNSGGVYDVYVSGDPRGPL